MIKKFLPLILVLLLSYWSVKSLINPDFFPMHDDTQVQRVFEMHKSLSDGMFPVRWVADLGYGYGYPIFNFYAPLAYYIGAFFMFLGFDSLIATKLMMGSGIILAGVFMYLLTREFWGEKGGILSGLLYLYAPYHALNIYVRGDVAEFWAYAFIPLAFLGLYKVFINLKQKNDYLIWRWLTAGALGYAGIILSHNLTAMMITPFIFIFALILYILFRMNETIYKPYFILLVLFIGILLSAFYWLPVFPELSYTNVLSVIGGGSHYKDHFVCLQQLWSSPWGFGGSAPGCFDGLSFKIGKIHILLSLLSLSTLALFYKRNKTKFAILIFFIASLLFSVFLTLNQSKFIWDAIPHMAFFQFPWRFLLLISFFTSFLGGAVSYTISGAGTRLHLGIFIIMVVVVIFLNEKLFNPQKYLNVNSDYYTSDQDLRWRSSKISDEYMPKDFAPPSEVKFVPKARLQESRDINISSFSEKTQSISFIANAKKDTDLVVNLAYFPAWHVFVDQKQIPFRYFSKGLIVNVPKGKHAINIAFTQTNIEKLGNFISLAGVITLLLGIITHRKNQDHA